MHVEIPPVSRLVEIQEQIPTEHIGHAVAEIEGMTDTMSLYCTARARSARLECQDDMSLRAPAQRPPSNERSC
jgi:hypothetical protein